jgi:hypothetical protein
MQIIPIETEDHAADMLVVVLDSANLERMKKADPAEVKMKEIPKNLVNPIITICYEHGSPEFKRLVQAGDLKALLKFLARGWEFRPDKGDHEGGPESLSRSN